MHEGDEVVDDVIGVASARLLAVGLSRGERLRALRLLGILGTVADAQGRVHRPLSLVASEFDLPADEVTVWLDDLAAVGVVKVGDGVIELLGLEPANQGMRLQDFLDAAASVDARPQPRARRRAVLLRPSSALVAAAAIVAVALVGPAVVDDDPTPASTSREEPATTTEPPSAGEPTASTSTTVQPAATASTQVGPVLVPATTLPDLPCPIGLPVIEVLGTTTGLDGRLTVDGIARNPTSQPMVIRSFTLRATAAGEQLTAPGTDHELLVPANGTARWQAALPVAVPADVDVQALLGDWGWRSADVRPTCPSP